ncbi:MAG: T9SS type A sorting domain-containing protein [Vicingaceae bacterium]
MRVKGLLILILWASVLTGQSNSWMPVDFWTDGAIRTMFADTIYGSLYLGGNIQSVNGMKASGTFRYDHSGPHVIDASFTIPYPSLCIALYKNEVYIGGFEGLYRFRNGSWDAVIDDPDSRIDALYVDNGMLLIGGLLGNTTGFVNPGIVQYDGNSFSIYNNAHNELYRYGEIYSLIRKDTLLIAAGDCDTTITKEIMAWDGSSWFKFIGGVQGGGLATYIEDMVVFQGELYVGGVFHKTDGAIANHILKWDGQQWQALGKGLVGEGVTSLIVYQDKLWVGGSFTHAGDFQVNSLATWDGVKWCRPFGDFNRPVYAMEIYKDTLYVSGDFYYLEGDPKKTAIVKYDPSKSVNCDITVGMEHITNGLETLSIYPNPVSSELNIRGLDAGKSYPYQIHGFQGRLVQAGQTGGSVDVSMLPTGLYLLHLTEGDVRRIGRFVRE